MGIEAIITTAVTVVLAIIGGGYTLWKNAKAVAQTQADKLEARIKTLEDKQKDFLDKETLRQILDRLDKMEETRGQYVTREEYVASQSRMEQVLERVSAAIVQTSTAMTSRMDSVLFEIAKQGEQRGR